MSGIIDPESKPFVVTGASGSIGSEVVKALARQGKPVVMACRNLEKGEAVRERILQAVPDAALELMAVNMVSLVSVCRFADALKQRWNTLGGLFNNAGTINRHFGLTEDGFENTLQVNYLSPYLLTRKLQPLLNDGGHLVNMVSLTRYIAKVDRGLFERGEKDYRQLGAYSDSKLALLLFTIALAKRVAFPVNMADPGVVNSNMIKMDRWFDPLADWFFRPFCKSPAQGAVPAVKALNSEYHLFFHRGNKAFALPEKYQEHPDLEWLWQETEQRLSDKAITLSMISSTS